MAVIYGNPLRDTMEREGHYDPYTAEEVLNAMDYELSKYVSDDVRDAIWNVMVKQFPTN
jgi:hypothetical protein